MSNSPLFDSKREKNYGRNKNINNTIAITKNIAAFLRYNTTIELKIEIPKIGPKKLSKNDETIFPIGSIFSDSVNSIG